MQRKYCSNKYLSTNHGGHEDNKELEAFVFFVTFVVDLNLGLPMSFSTHFGLT